MLNGLDKIEGLTPEMQEQINKLADGLVNKKTQLEEKLSKANASLSTEQSAQEQLAILKANQERDSHLAKENYDGALAAAKLEDSNTIERLTTESKADKDLIHELLVGKGLIEELTALGVDPVKVPRLVKSFNSEATIVDGKAMIGDKSLSDYMNEWGETDEGKSYIVGQQNSNSGGLGGSKVAQGKTMTEMNESERIALLQTNPTLFNQLKQAM
ncbi:MAG: hypothetical protein GY928_16455 [Colwellia sp.]|nr:hypothetical protein [Colwellia sp.]